MIIKKYKAFISYSHNKNNDFAKKLQYSLQKFGRKWYEVHKFKLFRDESSLNINPDLWGEIEKALKNSEYLIFIASVESSKSEWTNKEINWWLKNNSYKNLIIVLLDGEIKWSSKNNDFCWNETISLPKSFKKVYKSEPFFVDFRNIINQNKFEKNEVYMNNIASISSKLLNLEKDEIYGVHLKEQKKQKIILILLTISFMYLTFFSLNFYNKFQDEKAFSSVKEKIAQAGDVSNSGLVALSNPNKINGFYNDALLFSLYAYKVYPSSKTYKNMLETVLKEKYFIKQANSEIYRATGIEKVTDKIYILFNKKYLQVMHKDKFSIKFGDKYQIDDILYLSSFKDKETVVVATKSNIKYLNMNKNYSLTELKSSPSSFSDIKKMIVYQEQMIVLSEGSIYIENNNNKFKKLSLKKIVDFTIQKNILIGVSNNEIIYFNLDKNKVIDINYKFKNIYGKDASIKISDNGNYIVCHSITLASIYKIKEKKFIAKDIDPKVIDSIWFFSAKSNFLYSSDMFGRIKVWELNSNRGDLYLNKIKNNSDLILKANIELSKYLNFNDSSMFFVYIIKSGLTDSEIVTLDGDGVIRIFNISKNNIELEKVKAGNYNKIGSTEPYDEKVNILLEFIQNVNYNNGVLINSKLNSVLSGWNFRKGNEILFNENVGIYPSPVDALDFDLNKNILAIAGRGLVLYDLKNKKELYKKEYEYNSNKFIKEISYIDDKNLLFYNTDKEIKTFNIETKEYENIVSIDENISTVSFSKISKQLLIGTENGNIYLSDSDKSIIKLDSKKNTIRKIQFLKDNKYAYIIRNKVIIKSFLDKNYIKIFVHKYPVLDYDISSNNLLATVVYIKKPTYMEYLNSLVPSQDKKASSQLEALVGKKDENNIKLYNILDEQLITSFTLQDGAKKVSFTKENELIAFNAGYVTYFSTNLIDLICSKIYDKDKSIIFKKHNFLSDYTYPCKKINKNMNKP